MSDFITVAELRIEAERLCDENDQLKVENDELKNDADLLRAMLSQERLEKQCYMAENAELQETLQRRTEQFDGMTEMWVERGVESAKLRELVHVLLQCRVEGDDICAKCNYRSPLHGGCMADVKADELGVEVDDG